MHAEVAQVVWMALKSAMQANTLAIQEFDAKLSPNHPVTLGAFEDLRKQIRAMHRFMDENVTCVCETAEKRAACDAQARESLKTLHRKVRADYWRRKNMVPLHSDDALNELVNGYVDMVE